MTVKKGDRVELIGGPYRGRVGIIRRPSADGSGFVVNLFVPRGGLPQSPMVAASDIRRAEPAKIPRVEKRTR